MASDFERAVKFVFTYLSGGMADAAKVLNQPSAAAELVEVQDTVTVKAGSVPGVKALSLLPAVITGVLGYRAAQSDDLAVSASGVLSVASSTASGATTLAGSASGGIGAGGVAAGALATVAGFLSMASMVVGQFMAMGADAHAASEIRGAEGQQDGYHLGFAAGITNMPWSRAAQMLDAYPDGLTSAYGSPTQVLAMERYIGEFKAYLEKGYREAFAMSEEAKTEYQMCMYGFLKRNLPYISRSADIDVTIVHALVATAKQATNAACLRTFHDTDADGELDSSGPPQSTAEDLAAAAEEAEEICEAALEDLDVSTTEESTFDCADDEDTVDGATEPVEPTGADTGDAIDLPQQASAPALSRHHAGEPDLPELPDTPVEMPEYNPEPPRLHFPDDEPSSLEAVLANPDGEDGDAADAPASAATDTPAGAATDAPDEPELCLPDDDSEMSYPDDVDNDNVVNFDELDQVLESQVDDYVGSDVEGSQVDVNEGAQAL